MPRLELTRRDFFTDGFSLFTKLREAGFDMSGTISRQEDWEHDLVIFTQEVTNDGVDETPARRDREPG